MRISHQSDSGRVCGQKDGRVSPFSREKTCGGFMSFPNDVHLRWRRVPAGPFASDEDTEATGEEVAEGEAACD